MIPIDDTKSLFQLEDGSFKTSIYFSEEHAETFLALKRKGIETGTKLLLCLDIDKANVRPYQADLINNIEDGISRIVKMIYESKQNNNSEAAIFLNNSTEISEEVENELNRI